MKRCGINANQTPDPHKLKCHVQRLSYSLQQWTVAHPVWQSVYGPRQSVKTKIIVLCIFNIDWSNELENHLPACFIASKYKNYRCYHVWNTSVRLSCVVYVIIVCAIRFIVSLVFVNFFIITVIFINGRLYLHTVMH